MKKGFVQEMPDAVAACRVCLTVNVRLLTIAGSLQRVYEKLTDTELHTADGRPVMACYLCYAQLNKCRKLMLTSARAENVLNDMLQANSKITTKELSLIEQVSGPCVRLILSPPDCFDNLLPESVRIKSEEDTDVNIEINVDPKDFHLVVPTVHGSGCDYDEDDDDQVTPARSAYTQGTELDEDVATAQTSGAERRRAPANKAGNQRELKKRTTQGPFQCEVCQRWFKEKYNFQRHARIHTGEKPYQCDICQKRFSLNHHLRTHMQSHTGEKPFQCDICHKRFIRNSHLRTHSRTHTGDKTYICTICDKGFIQKINLLTHLKTHTGEKPYECNVCQKGFIQKIHLLIHSKTHTGERPYECSVCKKRFIQNIHLLKHIKIHTVKPYVCDGST